MMLKVHSMLLHHCADAHLIALQAGTTSSCLPQFPCLVYPLWRLSLSFDFAITIVLFNSQFRELPKVQPRQPLPNTYFGCLCSCWDVHGLVPPAVADGSISVHDIPESVRPLFSTALAKRCACHLCCACPMKGAPS